MNEDKKSFNPAMYAGYYMINQLNSDQEKKEEFIEKVKQFKNIHSLEEAKKALLENFPESKDNTHFTVFGVDCYVVNNDDLVRICINTPKEFISYEFV